MIVRELIQELQEFNQDLRVAVTIDGVPFDIKVWGYENVLGDETAVTMEIRRIRNNPKRKPNL